MKKIPFTNYIYIYVRHINIEGWKIKIKITNNIDDFDGLRIYFSNC
jgi:hypothetical protein